jgi:hypothetical protein
MYTLPRGGVQRGLPPLWGSGGGGRVIPSDGGSGGKRRDYLIMKRLFNMTMSEGESVADHLNDFNTVTNQLSSVKVDFDDEVRALLILCSLSKRWNGLVMDVRNSISGSNTLKFDDVVGVILSEEMRWKRTVETSGNALNMESRGRQKDREKGLENRENSRKGRSKSRLGKIECWNCGKKGHLKKDCRALKKQRDGQ